jgi:hypothetical protein
VVEGEQNRMAAYFRDDGEVRRAGAAMERRRCCRLRPRRLVDDHDLGHLGLHLAASRRGLGEASVREHGVARRAVVLHEHLLPAPRPAQTGSRGKTDQRRPAGGPVQVSLPVLRPRVGRAGVATPVGRRRDGCGAEEAGQRADAHAGEPVGARDPLRPQELAREGPRRSHCRCSVATRAPMAGGRCRKWLVGSSSRICGRAACGGLHWLEFWIWI